MIDSSRSQGDSQLCATVCCVLQHHGIKLQPLFVTRVTKAYLGEQSPPTFAEQAD